MSPDHAASSLSDVRTDPFPFSYIKMLGLYIIYIHNIHMILTPFVHSLFFFVAVVPLLYYFKVRIRPPGPGDSPQFLPRALQLGPAQGQRDPGSHPEGKSGRPVDACPPFPLPFLVPSATNHVHIIYQLHTCTLSIDRPTISAARKRSWTNS